MLNDNFDSYNNGDLNGQGNWSGSALFDIQDSVVQQGAKAGVIVGDGSLHVIAKSFNPETEGIQTCYVRQAVNSENFDIILLEDTTIDVIIRLQDDGNIAYWDGDLSAYTAIQSYNANQWYKFDIQVRKSDKKARYRVDNGTWTDWKTTRISYTTAINGLRIRKPAGGTATCYFDNFFESKVPKSQGHIF